MAADSAISAAHDTLPIIHPYILSLVCLVQHQQFNYFSLLVGLRTPLPKLSSERNSSVPTNTAQGPKALSIQAARQHMSNIYILQAQAITETLIALDNRKIIDTVTTHRNTFIYQLGSQQTHPTPARG